MLCFFQLRTFYILLILSFKHDIKAENVVITGQHDITLEHTEHTTSLENRSGSDSILSSTRVDVISNDTENKTSFIELSTSRIKQAVHKKDVSESTMSMTTNKTNTQISLDEDTPMLELGFSGSTLPQNRQFNTEQTDNHSSFDSILSNLMTNESLLNKSEIEGNQNMLSTREVKHTTTGTSYQQWNITTEGVCYTYGTCHFVSTKKFKYCNCDEKCHLFNNCCVDAKQNQTEQNLFTECHPFTNDKSVRLGALVLSHCPSLFNNTDVHFRCLNDDIVTGGPFVIGGNSMIYRNKFCALCNGVQTFKYFSLEIKADGLDPINDLSKTKQKERLSKLLTLGKYLLVSVTEGIQLRYCLNIPEFKSTENRANQCTNYSFNPIILSTQFEVYRNKFCVPQVLTDYNCFGQELDSYAFEPSYDFNTTKVTFNYDNEEEETSCTELTDSTCDTMETETYEGYTTTVNFTLASVAIIDDQFYITAVWP
ncbi:Hypothetical predicted protein [Mytilus galloprovincialis]|uniref:SMB domain-containing protein n=1 Tax=Mytilus galloprovincialis TaxID=29158 RepID=A0A8B6DCH2_MYTGA|nr:Hypothetical predicted protein [Mytilus galloprovincialis]